MLERGVRGAVILISQYLYPGCNVYILIFGGIMGVGGIFLSFRGLNGRSRRGGLRPSVHTPGVLSVVLPTVHVGTQALPFPPQQCDSPAERPIYGLASCVQGCLPSRLSHPEQCFQGNASDLHSTPAQSIHPCHLLLGCGRFGGARQVSLGRVLGRSGRAV